MGNQVILASGSFIRKKLMEDAGIDFSVIVKPVDEASIKAAMLSEGALPRDIADALAEAKAKRVSLTTPGFVIGADQIMVMDGEIFDKPKDMAEAKARLMSMRGKSHHLMGAVVICENGNPVWRHIAKTTLMMRDFSDAFLDEYLEQEGETLLSSVGAYRFEGPGAQLFSHVDGDFFSILGLSLLPVMDYLRSRGALMT